MLTGNKKQQNLFFLLFSDKYFGARSQIRVKKKAYEIPRAKLLESPHLETKKFYLFFFPLSFIFLSTQDFPQISCLMSFIDIIISLRSRY